MPALSSVVSMYQSLIKEWTRKPLNLDTVGKQLTGLKIALTELQFMPTTGTAQPQELVLARDVLEIGVQWSVLKQDIPCFERYMSQLKCYYFDYSGILPESPYAFQLLGLNLMCLLAQNRLAEFHTELERLPPKELQDNVYIRCPVSLEQYLMEGNYNKVFLTKGNVPAENYTFFVNILLETLRDEIASCLEKGYAEISFKEAAKMLSLGEKEVRAYGQTKGWQMNATDFVFVQSNADSSNQLINSPKLIENFLGYSKELERIV